MSRNYYGYDDIQKGRKMDDNWKFIRIGVLPLQVMGVTGHEEHLKNWAGNTAMMSR